MSAETLDGLVSGITGLKLKAPYKKESQPENPVFEAIRTIEDSVRQYKNKEIDKKELLNYFKKAEKLFKNEYEFVYSAMEVLDGNMCYAFLFDVNIIIKKLEKVKKEIKDLS